MTQPDSSSAPGTGGGIRDESDAIRKLGQARERISEQLAHVIVGSIK